MNPRSPRRPLRGFTLPELAIVMVIIALLLGGLLLPLGAQQDLRNYSETQKEMSAIGEALAGFAASHRAGDGRPYLPCPDTDNDGAENRSGNDCTASEGRLPWSALGVGREDAWGNRFRYRVTAAYANSATGFSLDTAGNLRVCESEACTALLGNALPAIVVSHGKNGAGAYNASGGTNAAPSGTDELANQDANADFVSHTHTQAASPGGEFDDIVVWLSPHVLFNRMISAGRLP